MLAARYVRRRFKDDQELCDLHISQLGLEGFDDPGEADVSPPEEPNGG